MQRIPSPVQETPIRVQNDKREEALKNAMLAEGGHLLGYLCVLTHGDEALAKDLAMETWLKVYRRFKVENFQTRGLLFRKAKQVFISRMRKEITRSAVVFRRLEKEVPSVSITRHNIENPSESTGWDEFWSLFEPRTFNPVDMKCFWLLYRYEFTINEVSSYVNMSASTIYDRVRRLISTCRRILGK